MRLDICNDLLRSGTIIEKPLTGLTPLAIHDSKTSLVIIL